MPSPSFNGAGSVHALLVKMTKLTGSGAPATGADNVLWSDALVDLSLGVNLNEPDAIRQVNGAGQTCLVFQAGKTIESVSVESFAWCTPDPRILEFLGGGDVILDETVVGSPKAIGYAAPAVGVPPKPNGVAVEAWSRAVVGSAQVGFYHWLFPRMDLVLDSEGFVLNAEDPLKPTFVGTGQENQNFGEGADGSWVHISDRVFQFVLEEDLPTYTVGYATETDTP